MTNLTHQQTETAMAIHRVVVQACVELVKGEVDLNDACDMAWAASPLSNQTMPRGFKSVVDEITKNTATYCKAMAKGLSNDI